MSSIFKRVLFITGAFPKLPCGVGDYTYQLTKSLTEHILEVHVLTLQHQDVINKECSPAGLFIHSAMPLWSLRYINIIADHCRKIDPDVIHIQYPSTFGKGNRTVIANLLGIVVKMMGARRVPVVTTLHEFTERSRQWRMRAIMNIVTSDAVICANRFDVDAVSKLSKGYVTYIPIASAIPVVQQTDGKKSQIRADLGIQSHEIVVAYFGFVTKQKGFDVLLQALNLLQQKQVPVKLLILTKLDPENHYHQSQMQLIEELDLRESCLLGVKHYSEEEISTFLQVADLAIFPFVDGTSDRRSSMLAALQHRLPTITTVGSSTPSNFVHEENMLLLPPGRADLLSEAVIRLHEDVALRQQLTRGAAQLSTQYSWSSIALRTIDVYHQLES